MGLYALQHRGQESAGIAAADGARIRLEKGMGLVNDVFTAGRLESLAGDRAIGHVRYSTSGDTRRDQRAAVPDRVPPRPDRGGAQRQPGERRDPAPGARGGGLDLPVHLGHRGDPPPLRAQPPRAARGRDRGEPLQGDGRVLAAVPDARGARRGARPVGLPAARAGPAQRGDRDRLRDLRARPDRREVRARRRAGRGAGRGQGRHSLVQAVPARAHGPLRVRARLLRAPGQPGVRPHRARVAAAARPPARARGARRPPTSSARCPTAAWARRSATRRRAACPSSGA